MSTSCAVCGVESTLGRAFRRQSVGRGKFKLVCPACRSREHNLGYLLALIVAVVMSVVGVGLIWSGFSVALGRAILVFGMVVLTQSLCILPHELGHALAALVARMRVFTVTIGAFGRIRFIGQWFGHDIVFRSIPLGGSTLAAPKGIIFARLRNFIFVLGGPLANVLLIAFAIRLSEMLADNDTMSWILAGFIWGNAVVLALSLFPRKVWIGTQQGPNDGLLLLTIPFASQKTVSEWHAARFSLEALEAAERGRLQDAEKWFAEGLELYPENRWSPPGCLTFYFSFSITETHELPTSSHSLN
jgi:hypothetical protein